MISGDEMLSDAFTLKPVVEADGTVVNFYDITFNLISYVPACNDNLLNWLYIHYRLKD